MANIAINTYCDQQCPFCYIFQLSSSATKTMPIEDYTSLLEWFADSQEDFIGITGGEPTLHPDFDSILLETDRYCRNLNATSMLYTNGSNLKEYLPYITENILITLNCLDNPKQKEIIALLDDLDYFSEEQAILRCNLHLGEKRYRYFWDIIDQYHITYAEIIITSPFGEYNRYAYDKEKYYTLMKPIFLQFCKNAIKHNCVLAVGCPEIPSCYFSQEEQEIIDQACDLNTLDVSVCSPVVEITPDWKASICFVSNSKMVDIRPFNSLIDLERYLTYKCTFPCIENNCFGRCTACPEYKLLQCQGGCLRFADIGKD